MKTKIRDDAGAYQTRLVLPGVPERPSETMEGRVWLRLRERYGDARVLKHAPRIARALKQSPRPQS